jgi:hypothetical protein
LPIQPSANLDADIHDINSNDSRGAAASGVKTSKASAKKGCKTQKEKSSGVIVERQQHIRFSSQLSSQNSTNLVQSSSNQLPIQHSANLDADIDDINSNNSRGAAASGVKTSKATRKSGHQNQRQSNSIVERQQHIRFPSQLSSTSSLSNSQEVSSMPSMNDLDNFEIREELPRDPIHPEKYFSRRLRVFRKLPAMLVPFFSDLVVKVLVELNLRMDTNPFSVESQASCKAFLSLVGIFHTRKTNAEARDVIKRMLAAASPTKAILDYLDTIPKGLVRKDAHAQREDIPINVPDQRRKKIVDLVQDYQPGKAMQILESHASREAVLSVALNPNLIVDLKQLHPSNRDDFDTLPEIGNGAPPLVLTKDNLQAVLSNLPRESSQGLGTWNFELIKLLCKHSDGLFDHIVILFNRILRGDGGPPSLWLASQLTPIGKASGGIRPIAVGDCWIRFLSKAVVKVVTPLAAQFLIPQQFGVGVSSGCEYIIHACQGVANKILSEEDSTDCILQVDCSNAFNTIGRRSIYNKLLHTPSLQSLLQFYHWAYGSSVPLYDFNRNLICTSEAGIRQGDPLGPLFFCLGLDDILKKISRDHAVTVLGYLDDLTLLGESQRVHNALGSLRNLLRDIGLEINFSKCKVFSRSSDIRYIQAMPRGIARSSDGIMILGAPIGINQFVTVEATRAIERYTEVAPLVLSFDPKVAYQLLKLCISTRAGYLLRTVPPQAITEAISIFDSRISKSLRFIINGNSGLGLPPEHLGQLDNYDSLPDIPDRVRALPSHMGGIGIRKGIEVKDCAWAASWLGAAKWLSSNIPDFFNSIASHLLDNKCIEGLTVIKLPELDDSVIVDIDSLHRYLGSRPTVPRQKDLTYQLVDKPQKENLERILSEPGLEAVKAYHLSESQPYTHLWLTEGASPNPCLRLSDAAFATNVGLRLLYPISRRQPPSSAVCVCNSTRLPVSALDFHAFSCSAGNQGSIQGPQSIRIERHNRVRDCLADYLRSTCPDSTILREPVLPAVMEPRTGRPGYALRADVSIRNGEESFYFDVAITNPSSTTAIDKGSHLTPLSAASAYEQAKSKWYAGVYNNGNGHNIIATNTIPFILETSGAFGNIASSVIDKLAKIKAFAVAPDERLASARKWFVRRVSVICARARHGMVAFFQRHIRYDAAPLDHQAAVMAPDPDLDDLALFLQESGIVSLDLDPSSSGDAIPSVAL